MQKRKITIKSGREEIQMEVTEEAYQKFYRPWWQQKKKEQRNREAMEAQGYRTESYEEWKENDMRTELFSESLEEMMEKTFTEDYLNGIRKKNEGQRPKYYVKDSHPAIISPEIFDRVQEEMFLRARLVLDEKGEKSNIGNRYSSKYLFSNLLVCGNCGAGFRRRTERGKIVWRCGTRMEKGKMVCGCSPTLQDEKMKRILAVAVCGGVYDENIVKNKVKRVDVYEKQIIICFAEENENKVCSL